jgi:hypothetical protein
MSQSPRFPLWFVTQLSSSVPGPRTTVGFGFIRTIRMPNGENALPLFSTEQKALVYAQVELSPETKILHVDNPADTKSFCLQIQQCPLVIVDPLDPPSMTITMAGFIQWLDSGAP